MYKMNSEPTNISSLSHNEPTIKHEKYVENGEEFDFTTYNDITVIVHVKSGYCNAGKICSDNGKEFKLLNRNQGFQRKISIVSSLVQPNTSEILLDLTKGFSNKVKGTYVHPLLVNYICMWANEKYAFKVDLIMNTINEELHLRNMKLNDKINEMEENVRMLKELNKDLCLPINRSIKTQIIIKKQQCNAFNNTPNYNNTYRITHSRIVKEFNEEDEIYTFEFVNGDDVYKIFFNLMKNYRFNFCRKLKPFECNDKVCMYLVNDLDDLFNFILEIKDNTLDIKNYGYEESIDINEAKFKCINNWLHNPEFRDCYKGKLYEFYCLDWWKKKYPGHEVYMWNRIPQQFVNEYNLVKMDYGKDLVDITSKTIIQCKYYDNEIVPSECVYTFLAEVNKFSEKGFNAVMMCSSNTQFNEDDLLQFEECEINVIRYDAEEMNKLLEQRLNDAIKEGQVLSEDINNSNRYDTTKYILANWNKSDKEILQYIVENMNPNFSESALRACRIREMNRDAKLISPYKPKSYSEQINDFILENWNVKDKELLKIIQEKFTERETSNYALIKRRHKLMSLYKHLKSPYNKIENKNISLEFVKNNWDMKDDEILEELNKMGLKYSKITIASRRKELMKQDETLLNPYKNTNTPERRKVNDLILEKWSLSDDELIKHILLETNIDLSNDSLRHQRMRLMKKNDNLSNPYFSQKISKDINEFIRNNINECEEVLSAMIKEKFNADLSIVAVRTRKNRELGTWS